MGVFEGLCCPREWNVVVFAQLPSFLLVMVIIRGHCQIPLGARLQPFCYWSMRCVCVRPLDHLGHCDIWRFEEIVEAGERVGAVRSLRV